MTSSSLALPVRTTATLARHPLVERYAPLATTILALVAIWYVAALAMNWTLVRDGFEREETPYTVTDVLSGTMSAERPLLPAPHQVVAAFLDGVFGYPPLAPRSLVYHSLVTLSATLLGFVLGALFGILLALMIVHSRVLERSLLPWIICSQMVPVLALAPIFIVVLGALGLHGLLPKSIISAYLCFFPIHIARSAANRTDADVVGKSAPDALEVTLAGGDPLSFHEPQSGHHDFAGRCHRRRAADGRGSRYRCASAGRLLLRADRPALGGVGRLRCPFVRADWPGRSDRARRCPAHGSALMDPRKLRLGLLVSAGAILVAFLLPLAPLAKPLLHIARSAANRTDADVVGKSAPDALEVTLAGGDPQIAGSARGGFWMIVIAAWLAAATCVINLAAQRPIRAGRRKLLNLLVPLLFGATVFYLWEVAVRGFGVPPVLLPSPSAAAVRFAASLPTLTEDFVQTFIRGVLVGYAIGCGAGLLVAILAHRFAFLGRGLLPLGNFFSALPLVGIAPIMVMWFGFDWPSKAAVVALVTFFPMLVNALAGLSASGHIERDLMRSYAATYPQSLSRLYLPAALPFIFNALKINATLALIGAIVAEFFGTPTQGIGFRISTEAGRMAIDMVWAEIALAALAGMAFYGLVTLAERATTFWHPSYRT